MGKYDRFDKFQEMQSRPGSKTHPIWRGIGCLLVFLVPIIAFAAADTMFDIVYGSGIRVMNFALIPSSGELYIVFFSFPLGNDLLFRVSPFHLIFTIVFSVVGFMIFSFAYSVIYRVTGPPRYGPTDAPPPRKTRKRR